MDLVLTMILRYSMCGSTISQFLDAKIRLRNRAEPGTFGGVCARRRLNYEAGSIGGGVGIIDGHVLYLNLHKLFHQHEGSG